MKNAKKWKTIEWERLEITSRNWRYQVNMSCKDGYGKGRDGKEPTEAEEIN